MLSFIGTIHSLLSLSRLLISNGSTKRQYLGYQEYGQTSDNISPPTSLRYPQIDAVYTWVNGSDPTWIREMVKYKLEYNREHNLVSDEEGDTATSSNRFRDNDELKFVVFHEIE